MAETDWEFTGNRAPSAHDSSLKPEEFRQLECSQRLDAYYEAYAERYPEFLKFMDQPEMREAWMLALMRENFRWGNGDRNDCIYYTIRQGVWDYLEPERDPLLRLFFMFFDPDDAGELALHTTRLRALGELALKGVFNESLQIVSLDASEPGFCLNPEVRYYLEQIMIREAPVAMADPENKTRLFTPEHKTGLSKARMAELRDAVARGDTFDGDRNALFELSRKEPCDRNAG